MRLCDITMRAVLKYWKQVTAGGFLGWGRVGWLVDARGGGGEGKDQSHFCVSKVTPGKQPAVTPRTPTFKTACKVMLWWRIVVLAISKKNQFFTYALYYFFQKHLCAKSNFQFWINYFFLSFLCLFVCLSVSFILSFFCLFVSLLFRLFFEKPKFSNLKLKGLTLCTVT